MAKTNKKRPVKKPMLQNAHNARPVSRRRRIVTETVGWAGTVFIISSYVLASFYGLSVHTVAYQVLNLLGALGVLTIATAKHVRQSMLVNTFWAVLAVVALTQIVLLHK